MALVYILNGPNLDMLGVRKTSVCGTPELEGIGKGTRAAGSGLAVAFGQTNHEGAPHDAIEVVSPPVIQLHLSNIFARESVRRHSWVSPAAKGVICGFGPKGYELPLEALASSGSAH